MSVKIRCRRTGANNDPCFRIIVADTRTPRDGESIEILGWYDPKRQGKNFALKLDRVDYWLSKGAIPSETVRSLVRKARKDAASPVKIAGAADAAADSAPGEQSGDAAGQERVEAPEKTAG